MTQDEVAKRFPHGTRVHVKVGRGKQFGKVDGITDKGQVRVVTDKGATLLRNSDKVFRA